MYSLSRVIRQVSGIVTVIINGLLLGIGFVFPILWPLVFPGVALLIYRVNRSAHTKDAFLYAWGVGTILHLCALWAVFWETMPLDWFGISSRSIELFAVSGSWILNAVILGLGVGIFSIMIRRYADESWKDIVIIPSCWVLSEWIGALIIYVANLGPGSLFGAHFTLGWIGYQLAHNLVLLQMAWFGGIYALSFVAVLISVLILRAMMTVGRTRYVYVVGISIIVVCAGVGHGYIASSSYQRNSSEELVRFAVVSRYQPPLLTMSKEQEFESSDTLHQLIKPLRAIDVLVFPEDSAFLRMLQDSSRDEVLHTFVSIGNGGGVPLVIDSEDIRMEDNPVHSIVSYWHGDVISHGYKQFLLPIGEYVPYFYQVVVRLLGGATLLHTIEEVRGYAPGPSGGEGQVRGSTIVTRFCDESMSPELYRSQVQAGANILVDISSLSWFHGSPLVYEQMKLVAKVRAVENGRWFVQSGNMSPAFAIDATGRLIGETHWGELGAIVVDVPPLRHTTPYTHAGVFLLLIPLVVVAYTAIKNLRRENE